MRLANGIVLDKENYKFRRKKWKEESLIPFIE